MKKTFIEDYVDVKDTEKKKVASAATASRAKMLLRQQSVGKKGVGKEVKISLVVQVNQVSSAATAMAVSFPCIPGNASEFSSLSPLFDEFIVDSVDFHTNISHINTNSSVIHAAWAYDPSNTGAYGSVQAVMEAEQVLGPVCNGGPTNVVSLPQAESATGFWHKKYMCPKGASLHDPNVLSVMGTGDWTSTGVATTSYGTIKGYVEAGASTVVVTNWAFLKMNCRFRIRS